MGDASTIRASHSGRDGSLSQGWGQARVEDFKVRGKDYLRTKRKVRCTSCLVQLAAVDCEIVESHKCNVASTSHGKSLLRRHGGRINFVVQFMGHVKGKDRENLNCSLVLWFVSKHDAQSITSKPGGKLFEKFRSADDAFRNSRFKVVPCIHKGSFAVKAVMGERPCLVANSMKTHYFCGKTYIECDIDLASCSHSRIQSLISDLPSMHISIAFVVQAQDEVELPEAILGCVSLLGFDPVTMARKVGDIVYDDQQTRRPIPALLRTGVRTGELSVRAVGWFPRRLWTLIKSKSLSRDVDEIAINEQAQCEDEYSEGEGDNNSEDTNYIVAYEQNSVDSKHTNPRSESISTPISIALVTAFFFIGAVSGWLQRGRQGTQT